MIAPRPTDYINFWAFTSGLIAKNFCQCRCCWEKEERKKLLQMAFGCLGVPFEQASPVEEMKSNSLEELKIWVDTKESNRGKAWSYHQKVISFVNLWGGRFFFLLSILFQLPRHGSHHIQSLSSVRTRNFLKVMNILWRSDFVEELMLRSLVKK